VLFDQGTPTPLRRHLHPHVVDTAGERGWSHLKNGDLLDHAEADRYDAFITSDTNLRYQQNLSKRAIRILVLTTAWPLIREKTDDVRTSPESLDEGGYLELDISRSNKVDASDT
jgi:hypothetical protein